MELTPIDVCETLDYYIEMLKLGEMKYSPIQLPLYIGSPSIKGPLDAYKTKMYELYEKYRDSDDPTTENAKKMLSQRMPTYGDVYFHIDYPVENDALFKVVNSKTSYTFEEIMYGNALAHQMMYSLEELDVGNPGKIEGMLNRKRSDGRYGIWGHDIEDLCYNGGMFTAENENAIIINFMCDS